MPIWVKLTKPVLFIVWTDSFFFTAVGQKRSAVQKVMLWYQNCVPDWMWGIFLHKTGQTKSLKSSNSHIFSCIFLSKQKDKTQDLHLLFIKTSNRSEKAGILKCWKMTDTINYSSKQLAAFVWVSNTSLCWHLWIWSSWIVGSLLLAAAWLILNYSDTKKWLTSPKDK